MRRNITVLIIILFVAAGIRLYRSNRFLPFANEQVDDLLTIRGIWQDITTGHLDRLPIHGQPGTYRWSYLAPKQQNPVYHGVSYYYFLLPIAVASRFDPYGVVLFLMALGVGTVYLLYIAGTLIFDETVGLTAALLGAVSFWLSAYSRWIWTPSLMAFFAVIALISFIQMVHRRAGWWYPFVLAVSLGSQIHDSGYMLIFFYAAAIAYYKPVLPRRWWQKLTVLTLFLFPIVPTIWTEVSTHFLMVRSLGTLTAASIPTLPSFLLSLWKSLRNAVGFTSVNNQFFIDVWSGIRRHVHTMTIVGIVLFIILIFLHNTRQVNRQATIPRKFLPLLVGWWIVFLPVPFLVEFLYADEVINNYSRMDNTLFFYPIIILTIAFIIVYFWRCRYAVMRPIGTCILMLFVTANVVAIDSLLWHPLDVAWMYAEHKRMAQMLIDDTAGKRYDAYFYWLNEGGYNNGFTYSPLYFLIISGHQLPEMFDGRSALRSPVSVPLLHRPADMAIYISEPIYLPHVHFHGNVLRIYSTPWYRVYRVLYEK